MPDPNDPDNKDDNELMMKIEAVTGRMNRGRERAMSEDIFCAECRCGFITLSKAEWENHDFKSSKHFLSTPGTWEYCLYNPRPRVPATQLNLEV